MPKLPRRISQERLVRALVRAGGVEIKGLGKDSHLSVRMRNQDRPITIPRRIKRTLERHRQTSRIDDREVFGGTLVARETMRTYTVLVHEAEEGGYWAEVEELPGCFASGETLDELERDVKGAIEQHIAALREMGEAVPEGYKSGEEPIRHWEIAVPA